MKNKINKQHTSQEPIAHSELQSRLSNGFGAAGFRFQCFEWPHAFLKAQKGKKQHRNKA